MVTKCLRSAVGTILGCGLLAGLLLTAVVTFSQNSVAFAQNKHKLDLEKIPAKVMAGLKARFPDAQIHKWSKEKEGQEVVYDFEFTQQGMKFEADIREDGSIFNWEKAVGFEDLPDAVKQAFNKKYPQSRPKEIMEITAVKDGKEELEGYEIVFETAQKKVIEVTFAPDGRVLEEGEDK